MTEQEAFLRLNLLPRLAGIKFKRLWDHFGSARRIIDASPNELRQAGGGIDEALAAQIRASKNQSLSREMDLIAKQAIRVITFQDNSYPENLRTIPDPPMVLYVKGGFKPEDGRAVAIVGSRRASFYGISCAERFGRQLAELGITVVSGMARGVDTAGHRGALATKGRTIAVLGSGLGNIYPEENQELSERIAQNGALISEFPMQTEPLRYNFPRRNRVISGLSLGVVVVEAAKNSGALITANFALEQGREVFAVPGKVDSANSAGVNELIKQGAKLTADIDDILEEVGVRLKHNLEQIRKPQAEKKLAQEDLSAQESSIVGIIRKSPAHIDRIIAESHLDVSVVMSRLMQLEMRHIVKQLPGKIFARVDA